MAPRTKKQPASSPERARTRARVQGARPAAGKPAAGKPPARKPSAPRAELHPRDPDATKARLVEAVGRLLARDGFGSIGLRSIAAEAGTDKKLIYRYFGGLPELLEAYADGAQFWPSNEELAGSSLAELRALPVRERWALVFKNYVAELRKRPLTREILRWELSGRNEVTTRLERVRESRGVALTAALAHDLPPHFDAPAVLALLSGGIHYLLLRAAHVRDFNGIDLQSNAGWQRLEQAALALVEHQLLAR